MNIITGLDIETTGLSQEKGHRIIEIAVVLYDATTQKEIGKFVRRINPERSIDPAAQAVHGISFEDLSGCPKWEEVAPQFVKILEKSALLVAHNGKGFDLPFIEGELKRVGLTFPSTPNFDTMVEGRWATFMGKLPSLKELCFATGIEYDPSKAHGAEYDVKVMMDAFFHGLNKGFFNAA
jgi:DNA polymerase-3 subunit epsilon